MRSNLCACKHNWMYAPTQRGRKSTQLDVRTHPKHHAYIKFRACRLTATPHNSPKSPSQSRIVSSRHSHRLRSLPPQQLITHMQTHSDTAQLSEVSLQERHRLLSSCSLPETPGPRYAPPDSQLNSAFPHHGGRQQHQDLSIPNAPLTAPPPTALPSKHAAPQPLHSSGGHERRPGCNTQQHTCRTGPPPRSAGDSVPNLNFDFNMPASHQASTYPSFVATPTHNLKLLADQAMHKLLNPSPYARPAAPPPPQPFLGNEHVTRPFSHLSLCQHASPLASPMEGLHAPSNIWGEGGGQPSSLFPDLPQQQEQPPPQMSEQPDMLSPDLADLNFLVL